MKLQFPSPLFCEIRNLNIEARYHSIALIAYNPQREFVCVKELFHYSAWNHFWKEIGAGKPNREIEFIHEKNDDPKILSEFTKRLIDGIHYIINTNSVLLGILHIEKDVMDSAILNEGVLFKFGNKYFQNMAENYHRDKIYPRILDNKGIAINFIGQGEKFFLLEQMTMSQIGQMTELFKGSLCGIVGVPKDQLQFIILSQNITTKEELENLKLDRNGRETLRNMIKSKQFSPAGGFRFDYGIKGLSGLPDWGSLELIPQFRKCMENYLEYLKAINSEKPSPFEIVDSFQVFNENIVINRRTEEKKKTLSTTELLKGKNEPPLAIKEAALVQNSSPPPVNASVVPISSQSQMSSDPTPQAFPQTVQKPDIPLKKPAIPLQKPDIPLEKPAIPLQKPDIPLEKPAIPLQKPDIPPEKPQFSLEKPKLSALHPISSLSKPNLEKISIAESLDAEEDSEFDADSYSDVFNQPESQLFNENGKLILDPSQFNDKMLLSAASSLEFDMGRAINPQIMSQNDIFADLEASLEAMSKLDELALKDEAISRIYYPPPTLISFANKEGMQIGGSLCVLSMGVGRNFWMIPELKRMQMWGKFYKDLDGNPQIEDFVAMEEKDISSGEELENMLQMAFINIRKNNHAFLGTIEIEGNGFERNVFDECELAWEDIEKLMNIHIERRQTIQFPELNEESFIAIKYYGSEDVIDFIANSKSQGMLEIASDMQTDERYKKGILCGIICVDMEASYFFVLSNNFTNLDEEEPKLAIDQKVLERMYEQIENAGLTPVSWFKIRFGFKSFESLFLWEDIKEGAVVPLIKDHYDLYLKKLVKTKFQEDSLKSLVESEMPDIKPNICPHCGKKNPPIATMCIACNQKLE